MYSNKNALTFFKKLNLLNFFSKSSSPGDINKSLN